MMKLILLCTSLFTLLPVAGKKVRRFNLPRKCIRRYFPHRRCFVFPPPVGDPQDMSRLEQLSESQLLPTFNERTKEFCDHILQNSFAAANRASNSSEGWRGTLAASTASVWETISPLATGAAV